MARNGQFFFFPPRTSPDSSRLAELHWWIRTSRSVLSLPRLWTEDVGPLLFLSCVLCYLNGQQFGMDSKWNRFPSAKICPKRMLFLHLAILQNGLPVLLLVKTYFKLQQCSTLPKMTGFKEAAESFINSFNWLAQLWTAGLACQRI